MKLGDLFYLNRHDRRILLVLLTVAAVCILLIWLMGEGGKASQADDANVTSDTSTTSSTSVTLEITNSNPSLSPSALLSTPILPTARSF